MSVVRQKSEIPVWIITIVLALLAAQSAYYNFNGTTRSDIAVLQSRIDRLDRDIERLRDELRGER